MNVLVVFPTDDRKMREAVVRLLSQSNGTVPLDTLETFMKERFRLYAPIQLCSESEAERYGFLERSFKVENNLVSLRP